MGPKQTVVSTQDLSIDHQTFANSKTITTNNKQFMDAYIAIQKEQYTKWDKQIAGLNISSPYLLMPIERSFSSKDLCGSSGTLTLRFESFPYQLSEQINNRKQQQKKFEECELWFLLHALACAKKDIVPVFGKIGDVRPQNIFINDLGKVKAANRFSWPQEPPNTQKFLQNQPSYLSPQELRSLESHKGIFEDNEMGQIFSIGLTLLSCIHLENYEYLYNTKQLSFNFNHLKNDLNRLGPDPRYSVILKATIFNLLQVNQEQRLTPAQLWTWITLYENEILSKDNFVIKEAPNKLHRKVAQLRKLYSLANTTCYSSPTTQGVQYLSPSPDQRTILPEQIWNSQYMGHPSSFSIGSQNKRND